MLVTVQGTYENGTIRLDEPVPATEAGARPVLVVFLEPEAVVEPTRYRFSWQDPNSPINQQPVSTASVADEVIAERQERG